MPSNKIIDVHAHPIFFGKGSSKPEVDKLVSYSKSLGIDKMVCLGDVLVHGPSPSAKQLTAINEQTRQLLTWYPDFFIGFCYLNPTLGEKRLRAELDRCLNAGFQGIKLEIANNARDPIMKPLMRAAAHYQIPVLQHTWDTLGKPMRRTHSDPRDTCLLAHRFPDTKVIMAHLYGFGMRGVLEAQNLPNLYIDTSSCLPFAGLLEYAVEKLGPERILYGSDIPIRELGQCIGRITGSDIPAAAKTQILYSNANTLFNLA
ncbi:amidohydrolase family protein [Pelagicoccus sp. SDUM812002]|uniref:amidohydrolase family protein n=1 Tax=Pelagicoccus sp. SDUM812002 TaxID=3041266 RepID=UPI00280D6D01|nr:amidohydrolase family protein [Pelagicoccus sp. SDUM812002]MDQ8187700.1 amidohydrolase family protein [Pelagicoccus sp. SDUM812002]